MVGVRVAQGLVAPPVRVDGHQKAEPAAELPDRQRVGLPATAPLLSAQVCFREPTLVYVDEPLSGLKKPQYHFRAAEAEREAAVAITGERRPLDQLVAHAEMLPQNMGHE